MSLQQIEYMSTPVAELQIKFKPGAMSKPAAKFMPAMNFQELMCIYLSWVGLPLPAKFQPKQPRDYGCGSFPGNLALLLDTWVKSGTLPVPLNQGCSSTFIS